MASTKTRSSDVSRDQLADFLRQMYEIRFFEEKVSELLKLGIIKGASHLYAGEEAVAVGAISTITENDVIASTHRGHGHCGAMGVKHAKDEAERQTHWNKMMAELMGRATGYCKGRGGSMHIADVEKGNLGSTGIVGGNIPIGTGAALAEKLKGTNNVVLCFFGDGASNTGSFHESLNMGASLLCGLPIVYICENNLYGMSVPFHDKSVEEACSASKIEDIYKRAAAYDIPGEAVDGMDIFAVRAAVSERVEAKARPSSRPRPIAGSAIPSATSASIGPRKKRPSGSRSARLRPSGRSSRTMDSPNRSLTRSKTRRSSPSKSPPSSPLTARIPT